MLIACLLAVPLLGHRIPLGARLGIVYAVVAAASCFAQFFDPSRMAIIGAIVPADDQPRASGQLQAAMSFAQILGPPIAAPLLFALGVEWALILNAASFAASFLCIRAIRMPAAAARPAERPDFAAEFLAGVRFFAGSKVLITLAAGVVIATLGTGALNALAVFFVHVNLHVSASWLGTVVTAVGVGAVGGALLAGRAAKVIAPARAFWLGLLGCGVALIAFSRATALPAALVIGLLVGAALGLINSVLPPLLLGATPQHLIGRVSAVINPVQQLASILSMAAAGLLASTVLRGFHAVVAGLSFGPYDTIYLFAGLMFVVAGLASIAPLRSSMSGAAGRADEPEGAGPGPADGAVT